MKENSLLIAPKFDRATEISFNIYKSAKEKLGEKNFVYLEEKNATRENFEDYIKDCESIAFWDHGNATYLVDQNKNHLIDLDNLTLLRNKEVWTVACLSGRELGPKAINAGARLWQGYDETVSVTDQVPFFDMFENSLNKGYLLRKLYNYNFKDCEKGQREAFKKNIELCESMPNNSGLFFAALLSANLKHLKYFTSRKPSIFKKIANFFKKYFEKKCL
jgi:hypothetical protein